MRRDVCLSVWGQRPATDSIWLSILLLAPSISQVHSQLKTKKFKNQQQKRVERKVRWRGYSFGGRLGNWGRSLRPWIDQAIGSCACETDQGTPVHQKKHPG
ncbi:hypothetical protein J3E69DRAFT_294276 [Trichoderma sp. SZMC 28015]